jgi:hypothetical protein
MNKNQKGVALDSHCCEKTLDYEVVDQDEDAPRWQTREDKYLNTEKKGRRDGSFSECRIVVLDIGLFPVLNSHPLSECSETHADQVQLWSRIAGSHEGGCPKACTPIRFLARKERPSVFAVGLFRIEKGTQNHSLPVGRHHLLAGCCLEG